MLIIVKSRGIGLLLAGYQPSALTIYLSREAARRGTINLEL